MSTPAGDDLVGNATIRVDGDTDPATRALAGFSRDAQGRLRDVRGRFVSETQLINRTVTNNTPTLTVNTTPATNALNTFTRDVNGRLRDVNGRFVRAGDDVSNSLTRAAGGGSRFTVSLRGLANAAGTAAGVLGRVGIGISAIGAAAGTAAPLLAGIVTTLENIAPAGAVAVTGMLAITQATAAIKLGMVGVEDAVTSAFDTSEAGAKKFDEALKKLAPNARAFAVQVRGLQPAFQRFQQGIQNRLFAGFAGELKGLSTTVLPVVRKNLNGTADTLNRMALGAGAAARGLATSGTLGKAMAGANKGLTNLQKIPGQVVTGLGQLAAAGAPAFDRITAGAANAATGISERLSKAFESGALQEAVDTAVDVLKDLGTVGANVFGTLGNIMGPVQAAGGGLVGVLVEISGALKDATGTEAFQSAIGALAGVMATLARTAGPLLGQALAAIAPVFTALGPPVERLITSLGAALGPVIENLGPVLEAAAGAVGVLVDALSPLLPVIGNLIASLLPPLVPAIQAIAGAWAGAAPIVAQLGQILTAVLAPIIAQLPTILTPLINTFTQVTAAVLPLVSQLLTALTPALTMLGQSFADIMVAVGPLLSVLGELLVQALAAITPVLMPVITFVGRLASILAGELATRITTIVVPAIQTITSLLQGDFSGAFENAKRAVSGMVSTAVRLFTSLPGQIFSALGSLVGTLRERASTAGSALLKALREKIGDAVEAAKKLPGRVKDGLGNLGTYLASAGRDLIAGMIGGVREKAGDLASAAADVVGDAIGAAKSALGISSPSKVFAQIGRDTGAGFVKGLTGTEAQIKAAATKVSSSITKAFRGRRTRVDDRLVSMVERGNVRLRSLARQRDAIAKQIADAQKFATDLAAKARATGSLSSIVSDDFFAPSFVEKRMRQSLNQIKAFTANVAKLQKKGLSKSLIRQILEMGPEAGSQFAASLAGADQATIKRFNKLQSQIGSASTKLGKQGADMLFDSGKKAGQGFLTGLKAQQKNIEKLMLSIAKGMQRAIRKALGIRSPSRVMASVGQMTVLGLEGGITRMVPAVDQAMARLAGAVTSGAPTTLPALGTGGMPTLGVGAMRTNAGGTAAATTVNVTLNLTNQGVIGSRMEAENWLARALDNLDRTGRLPKTLRAA